MAAMQTAWGQRPEGFELDAESTLAGLELAWADEGYHGFCADGGIWSAISSTGEVLTGGTPDVLNRAMRAHWQARQ